MKKLIAVVCASFILSPVLCRTLSAKDEGWYAAGGLLGGLLVGSAIAHSHVEYYPPAQPVYYAPPCPVYSYPVYQPPVRRTYRTYREYTPYGVKTVTVVRDYY